MEVNPHPLTVDVVVLEILRYVSPSMKDLLAFRQVCRLWRQLATPIISSRSLELPLITFKSEGVNENEIAENCANCNCNPELSLLPKYIDYLESDDGGPKIIFSVFQFIFIALEHPILKRFLEEFGHTVKKLHLNHIYGRNVDADGDVDSKQTGFRMCVREGILTPQKFRRLLLSCPNLEELVLGYVAPEGGEDGFLLPDDDFMTKIKVIAFVQVNGPQEKFISDLLKVCPSLETFLNVEDSGGRYTRALSQSPHLSALKELTITQEDMFETLIHSEGNWNLQLKKLKFEDLFVAEEPEEFCRFMDSQKSCLETLIVKDWKVDLDIDGINVLPRVPFPDMMEKLEVLKIGNVTAQLRDEPDPIFTQLLFQPLDFRRQFPILKTLILGGDADQNDFNDLFAPGWEPQMVLEGLVLPWGIEREDLRRIAELFPNVKHLSLGGVVECELRVLWSQWPQLESLYLELPDDVHIETVLTGLLALLQIPEVQSLIDNGEDIIIPANYPSIVNLSNLKELRIDAKNEIGPHRNGEMLTDVSIHYSLSKMRNLEFLGVNGHRFSDEGINFLCNGTGLKWNENGKWPLQCQKDLDLEYAHRPNCDEEFSNYIFQSI